MLNVPFPDPVAVAPLLRVNVHAPPETTFPAIDALAPAQIALLELVIAAVGLVIIFTAVLPVKSEDIEVHLLSVKDEIV
jgi:hypothetical protein